MLLLLLQAEAELRVAQADFDRQAEITKLLLEGVSSTHVSQSAKLLTPKAESFKSVLRLSKRPNRNKCITVTVKPFLCVLGVYSCIL